MTDCRLKGIEHPHNNDVLSGRGNFVNAHAGNKQYRVYVQSLNGGFVTTVNSDKAKIAREVVHWVRNLNPPGRFLKRDPDTELWFDIGDKYAYNKARQLLREITGKLKTNSKPILGVSPGMESLSSKRIKLKQSTRIQPNMSHKYAEIFMNQSTMSLHSNAQDKNWSSYNQDSSAVVGSINMNTPHLYRNLADNGNMKSVGPLITNNEIKQAVVTEDTITLQEKNTTFPYNINSNIGKRTKFDKHPHSSDIPTNPLPNHWNIGSNQYTLGSQQELIHGDKVPPTMKSLSFKRMQPIPGPQLQLNMVHTDTESLVKPSAVDQSICIDACYSNFQDTNSLNYNQYVFAAVDPMNMNTPLLHQNLADNGNMKSLGPSITNIVVKQATGDTITLQEKNARFPPIVDSNIDKGTTPCINRHIFDLPSSTLRNIIQNGSDENIIFSGDEQIKKVSVLFANESDNDDDSSSSPKRMEESRHSHYQLRHSEDRKNSKCNPKTNEDPHHVESLIDVFDNPDDISSASGITSSCSIDCYTNIPNPSMLGNDLDLDRGNNSMILPMKSGEQDESGLESSFIHNLGQSNQSTHSRQHPSGLMPSFDISEGNV